MIVISDDGITEFISGSRGKASDVITYHRNFDVNGAMTTYAS